MIDTSSQKSEIKKGALVLVVGPSGSGKDTLIGLARTRLADDPRFVFPRRVITREAQADAEDHDTLDVAGFDVARNAGQFALHWGAHGLFYGLTKTSLESVNTGATAIINVSRGVIAEAEALEARITVISVKCRPELLAERIARRGRETADDILLRLKREAPIKATTARVIEIVNETDPLDVIDIVIDAIRMA
ncbi:MAG: phosphonate metabolism protein/1,5-bisphosphokinase (PRPP-forming) PhnN [Alphaproteobacteria bacterium]